MRKLDKSVRLARRKAQLLPKGTQFIQKQIAKNNVLERALVIVGTLRAESRGVEGKKTLLVKISCVLQLEFPLKDDQDRMDQVSLDDASVVSTLLDVFRNFVDDKIPLESKAADDLKGLRAVVGTLHLHGARKDKKLFVTVSLRMDIDPAQPSQVLSFENPTTKAAVLQLFRTHVDTLVTRAKK